MRTPSWHPDIDVEESDEGWLVVARLPGVAPDGVTIDVHGRNLVIRAAHDQGQPAGGAAYPPPRRPTGFFYRLVLPAGVDSERIEAVMEHGLLVVRIPLTTSRTRRIAVARRIHQSNVPDRPASAPGEE